MNLQSEARLRALAAAARRDAMTAVKDFVEQAARMWAPDAEIEPFIAEILEWRDLAAVAAPRAAFKAEPPDDRDAEAVALDESTAELEEIVAEAPPEADQSTPAPAAPVGEIDMDKPGGGDKSADDRRSQTQPVTKPRALPTSKDKPLSDEEIIELLERDARGESAATIAAALGRSKLGFHSTVAKLRREAGEADEDEDESDDDAPDDRQSAAAPASGGGMIEPSRGAPLKEKALHATLNAIGYEAPWSPVNDAILVVMLSNGEGVPAVVEALGVSREAVIARWNVLLPVKGIDEQTLLVRVLKARAEIHQRGKVAAE